MFRAACVEAACTLNSTKSFVFVNTTTIIAGDTFGKGNIQLNMYSSCLVIIRGEFVCLVSTFCFSAIVFIYISGTQFPTRVSLEL